MIKIIEILLYFVRLMYVVDSIPKCEIVWIFKISLFKFVKLLLSFGNCLMDGVSFQALISVYRFYEVLTDVLRVDIYTSFLLTVNENAVVTYL